MNYSEAHRAAPQKALSWDFERSSDETIQGESSGKSFCSLQIIGFMRF